MRRGGKCRSCFGAGRKSINLDLLLLALTRFAAGSSSSLSRPAASSSFWSGSFTTFTGAFVPLPGAVGVDAGAGAARPKKAELDSAAKAGFGS